MKAKISSAAEAALTGTAAADTDVSARTIYDRIPELDRLPRLKLPDDLDTLAREIAELVTLTKPGQVWLLFRNEQSLISRSYNHRWRWHGVPEDPSEVRKTLRALDRLGFVRVCDGGTVRPVSREELEQAARVGKIEKRVLAKLLNAAGELKTVKGT